MKIAGIIAEFNPFHNGHAALIRKAREAGAGRVAAVMSGSFVQRGEPAVFDCETRTRAALENGVDLVLQLPSVYAVSGAQTFARAGVAILDALGVTDELAFGSECASADKIIRAARNVYGEEIKAPLAEELKKGVSFAAARETALEKISPESAEIIRRPNDILGVEYAAALERIASGIVLKTFLREGARHDSPEIENGFASGSLIRERIRNGGEWKKFVPEKAARIYEKAEIADISKIETAILYRLRTVPAERLASAPDVSEGIENRIAAAAEKATSLEELYALAKTRRYSHARIRRIALNFFLGAEARDAATPAPYIRVLGFNKAGAETLASAGAKATKPIVNRTADFASLGSDARRIFALERAAGDVFALCFEKKRPCGAEKNLRPVIID